MTNISVDIDDNHISVYIRGINLIYANDGDETYYHLNAHGDVIALTDEDGVKEKSYSYNAFGVEEDPSALDDNPFRYCGEYFDKVNEKIYLRARYYDANQGRFTQEDPIRDGYNWYAYCANNPIMFVDPNGTDAYYVTIFAEDGGLDVVGHALILVQDADGVWYKIEYTGSSKPEARINIKKIDDIEKLFFEWKTEEKVYIEGDFSKCIPYAEELVAKDAHYGGYCLFFNNCLHFAKDVLSKGDFKHVWLKLFFLNNINIIPALFYFDLKNENYFWGEMEKIPFIVWR